MRRPAGIHHAGGRLALLAAGGAMLLGVGCPNAGKETGAIFGKRRDSESQPSAAEGRLLSRPKAPDSPAPPPGTAQAIELTSGREALLYVPKGYRPGAAFPLVVTLHGAGGDAQGGLDLLLQFADEAGLILLAPESRAQTWDVIVGGYGADVASIDRALHSTFSRVRVDVRRIAIGGFSDGASYALSVGLANGDLFGRVIAFSPGFVASGARHGSPRIFISHGSRDEVLPIQATSRRIVPSLRRAGYEFRYEEFEGGHAVPTEIARQAVAWLLQ